MKITEQRVYRGPSVYAHFPVMRLTVDLGGAAGHRHHRRGGVRLRRRTRGRLHEVAENGLTER